MLKRFLKAKWSNFYKFEMVKFHQQLINFFLKGRPTMSNIAILTAAGVGSRFGQDVPKQFLSINDKPLIVYTMEKFQQHPEIDDIAVVCLDGWEGMLRAYAKQFGITKLRWVFKGGETGMKSIQNAVFGLREELKDDDIILVQDGIRVNTSERIITDCIKLTKEKGVAIATIPLAEVPYFLENGETKELDRDKLLRTQTPHGIRYKKLVEIHEEANQKGITSTVATCTLMTQLGYPIYFFDGAETNFKITTLDDIEIFRALLVAKKVSWQK